VEVYGYGHWENDAGTGGTLAAPNADRARWKGALWLGPELDLYYMRNRWYEPGTGRFLSEDPVGLGGGINPVIFAGGDGVNGRDPAGLDPCRDANGNLEFEPIRDADGTVRLRTKECLGDVTATARRLGPLTPTDPVTFPDPPCPGCNEPRDPTQAGGRTTLERTPGDGPFRPIECKQLESTILVNTSFDAILMGWGGLTRFTTAASRAGSLGNAGRQVVSVARGFGAVFKLGSGTAGFVEVVSNPRLAVAAANLPFPGFALVIGGSVYLANCR